MDSALRKKAKKLELKALEESKINGGHMADLNQMLCGFYVSHCPQRVDYHHRRELVRIFNQIAKEIYGNPNDSPSVECFGSFVMDMFSAGSDLDLSINFSGNAVELSRDKKIKTLWKFAKKLYSLQSQGHVYGIQTIMTARVPIVKVIDRGTGIECDLSVENRDGVAKSQIVHIVSALDERFKKLSLLMKAWAKAHDINSSKDRTLNSLSIIALVAFHLQTRDPPILPPFSLFFKDGANPAAVRKVVQNYLDYGIRNKESLAELFITLFVKLSSIEKLWGEGLCASLYEGSWISKAPNPQLGLINVEDFTDRTQNVARAVGSKGFKKIYRCIHHSLSDLLAVLDGQTPLTKLKELLFGVNTVSSTRKRAAANEKHIAELPVHQKSQHNKRKRLATNIKNNAELHGHQNSQQNKRRQSAEGWVVPQRLKKLKGMQPAESWGGNRDAGGWEGAKLGSGWGGKQPAESWGGNRDAGGWDGAKLGSGWGGKQPAESWGGNRDAGGWDGAKLGSGWGGKQPAESWGGNRDAGGWDGAKLGNGWGGKQEVWGRTQLPKHWREPQLVEGGRWQTGSWGGARLVEGFGVAQPAKGWAEKRPLDGSWVGTQGCGEVQPTKLWGGKWSFDGWKQSLAGWGGKGEVVGWGGKAQSFVGRSTNAQYAPPHPWEKSRGNFSLGDAVYFDPPKFGPVPSFNPTGFHMDLPKNYLLAHEIEPISTHQTWVGVDDHNQIQRR
ncbi:terminal uridylyltransferase 7-like [Tripterygium wilfordii]|uniref:Terminal uridylyltransferase 7-like n=1 Tax=Tripterygium wilfordii TaxID=458696 RepID=A0A7J7DFH0_TRIWF|nr:terminal uridylyltransferase 7-like [Tripterygium wilfordii]